ncbi:MAG: ACP S-malonyltransferase [candidate division WOR-3 bacterium]
MARYGLLFPGQGSQFVGMGSDLYERFPACRDVYDRAEQVLELPIRRLSFEGPEEELRQTRYTQPAILTHSLAVLAALPELTPGMAAGHSLGEYAALYAAGSLDFVTVLRLVKRRAELMYSEGTRNPGSMAAIIGLEAAVLETLCKEADGVVVPANYNEPRQTVVSGEPAAVKQVTDLASSRGAIKTVMLPVSGAFHSPLLSESAREFSSLLEQVNVKPPVFPVIMNVTGRPVLDAIVVRENLARQLISPVRWHQTMLAARELGFTEFLETGPGNVLAGLARRIDREFRVTPLGRAVEIDTFLKTQERAG